MKSIKIYLSIFMSINMILLSCSNDNSNIIADPIGDSSFVINNQSSQVLIYYNNLTTPTERIIINPSQITEIASNSGGIASGPIPSETFDELFFFKEVNTIEIIAFEMNPVTNNEWNYEYLSNENIDQYTFIITNEMID